MTSVQVLPIVFAMPTCSATSVARRGTRLTALLIGSVVLRRERRNRGATREPETARLRRTTFRNGSTENGGLDYACVAGCSTAFSSVRHAWIQSAHRSKSWSLPGSATHWTPTGNISGVRLVGRCRHGHPKSDQIRLNTEVPVVLSPSGASEGALGVKIKSNCANRSRH